MPSSPFMESIRTELKTWHYSIRTEKIIGLDLLYASMISNRWGIMK
jgi:hypothetical protein